MTTELDKAIHDLLPYFKKTAVFSLLASMLVFAPSLYMLEVYDRVINSRSYLTLGMLTILVLGALALMEVLEWIRSEILLKASIAFDKSLHDRILDAILQGNLRGVKGCSIESMKDFSTLRDFIYSPVIPTLLEIPTSILMLIILYAISPILGWSAVAGALLQTTLAWINQNAAAPALSEANLKSISAQRYADSARRNSAIIESMGMLEHIHIRWAKKHRDFLNFQSLASDRAGYYQAAVKFVQNVVASMMLGLSAWLLLREQLNGGAAYMIFGSILGGRSVSPLVQLVAQWQTILNARSAYGRLDQMLSNIPVQMVTMTLPPPVGKLNVESLVAYAPSNRTAILKGVSFSLNPGEVLVVIGPSAAGKTSLAKALVGLLPAASGKVRLDGVDMYEWNKSELGPHIGYLPQNVDLLEGTIAENVARFGEIDQIDIELATSLVGLHEFVESMPLGYSTPVGRDGQLLSGGQRQRVGLARAIYRMPSLVVMDEPNSNLDEDGDLALARAIIACKSSGSTVVVMAHRSSILEVADKVLVLKDGQSVAFGPRDQVFQQKPSMPENKQTVNSNAAQSAMAISGLTA